MIHTPLSHLTDAELLRHVENERDPLTSTDAEIELVERFNALLDEHQRLAPVIKLVDDLGLDDEQIALLGDTFEDFHLNDVIDLRTKLERSDKFYDIASDAGDVIVRLNDLINTTL